MSTVSRRPGCSLGFEQSEVGQPHLGICVLSVPWIWASDQPTKHSNISYQNTTSIHTPFLPHFKAGNSRTSSACANTSYLISYLLRLPNSISYLSQAMVWVPFFTNPKNLQCSPKLCNPHCHVVFCLYKQL